MDGSQIRTRTLAGAVLDAAALEKKFAIRKRAREDGAHNHPPHDAHDLSDTERAIVDIVADERARLDHARAETAADAERRLRALTPAPPDLSSAVADARLALRQIEGRLAHDWGLAGNRARQARADLDSFRRIHNLRRAAVTPGSTLLQAGLLLIAALFEALFSATLFAEVDPRGLLGGAVTAVGLSGANVVLGFLAGYIGLRYLQHARMPLKTLGALAFAILLGFAVVLNWGAAGWRDMLAEHDATSDATQSLWSSILRLQSPQAVVLLMLGAGVWVFAALKGYSKFDDPYPDYGKMDRATNDAEDALSEFRDEARDELEAPLEDARRLILARVEKVRADVDAMSKAYDSAALKMQAHDAHARSLDETLARAVQLYRQENAAARSSPAPIYFGVAPPAAGPAADALIASAGLYDAARATLATAQKQATEALEALIADLDAAQARLDGAA